MFQFVTTHWKEISGILWAIWELVGRAVPTTNPVVPSTKVLGWGQKLLVFMGEVSKMADNLTGPKLK